MGQLAEHNVGEVISVVKSAGLDAQIIRNELAAEGTYPADPSHCLITGTPTVSDSTQEYIGDLIARTLIASHPARRKK